MNRRAQLGRPASMALLVLLAACGHLAEMTQPPADWPQLTVIDHGAKGTIENCSQFTNFFTWPPLGCAIVYFKIRSCEVWAIAELIRQEELKHCEGRDHAGESTLADAWSTYKASE